MTSFKRYALYHAKSTLLRGAVTAAICLLLCFTFMDVNPGLNENGEFSWVYIRFSVLAFILAVLATVMPFLELSGFKTRRNLDTLFSMPVSRTKMATVHFFNGLLQLVGIYTLCFLSALVRIPSLHFHTSDLLLPCFAMMLLFGVVIYVLICFVLVQAETTIDGLVLLALYSFPVPYILISAIGFFIGFFTREYFYHELAMGFFLYNPLFNMASRYSNAIVGYKPINVSTVHSVVYLTWLILSVAAAVGYFLTFARHRAEQVGGLSETFFGYRVLIPLVGIISAIVEPILSTFVMFFIAMVVGYIIYRRSVRLRRSDLIMLAVTTGVFLISGLIG